MGQFGGRAEVLCHERRCSPRCRTRGTESKDVLPSTVRPTNRARNKYLGDPLGSGAFSTVYECRDDWGRELVAKVLAPQNQTYEEVKAAWADEFVKLQALRHPNVTYVFDAFEYRDTFYLIIERCAQTLADIIRAKWVQEELWVPHVARDVLQALEFLHDLDYAHKDLHAGNVFVSWRRDTMVPSKEPVVSFKVGDVGIARLEAQMRTVGTLMANWMLPPEYLQPSEFGALGRSVDIYHAALLLLQLLLGEIRQFSHDEIVAGVPRQIAEKHSSPFGPAISLGLRRHVTARPPSPLDLWVAID